MEDPTGNADPCTYGAGYLNIPAALASTVTVSKPALSPKVYQDTKGNAYIDTTVIGSRSIWGTSSLTDLRSIWGSSSLSGTSSNLLSSSRSIWGTASGPTARSGATSAAPSI